MPILRRKKDRVELSDSLQNEDIRISNSVQRMVSKSSNRKNESSNHSRATGIAAIIGTITCTVIWLLLFRQGEYSMKNRFAVRWDGRTVDLMPSIQEYMRIAKLGGNFSAFQRVYVVKGGELLVSNLLPKNPDDRMVAERANMTEPLLSSLAHKLPNDAVFLANYRDSRFCLNETLFAIGEHPVNMVPILTLSRPVACEFSFPMPTYETIRFAAKRASKANDILEDPPPLAARDKRVVWRGSPTGKVRIDLATFARNHVDLLDYELTFFLVTGKKGNTFMGPNDLQQYRAILDVDGASWSSRFGSLLCSPSVVLKFDPLHVDYFQEELKPFVHYIPVYNTSDLLDKARFVADDDNLEYMAKIIRNANQWCESRLRPSEIEEDMLSVLLSYSKYSEKINSAHLMSKFNFSKVMHSG